MKNHIKKIPMEPSFRKNGFDGYCYPLDTEKVSLTVEKSYKGHDTYCTNTRNTSIFYVIEGNGKFIIDGIEEIVEQGDIVEIPAHVEFTYIGKMDLLYISAPAYQHDDFQNNKINNF